MEVTYRESEKLLVLMLGPVHDAGRRIDTGLKDGTGKSLDTGGPRRKITIHYHLKIRTVGGCFLVVVSVLVGLVLGLLAFIRLFIVETTTEDDGGFPFVIINTCKHS